MLVDMHPYIRCYQEGHPGHLQSQCGEILALPCAQSLGTFPVEVSLSIHIDTAVG